MDARIPNSIKPLLAAYIHSLESELPGLLTACYLHGSLALGAFDERLSDIDFVTVLNRPLIEHELNRLEALHKKLADQYPRWPLQGSYLQWSDLGRVGDATTPYPHYSDGKLASGHHENAITWWLLKNRGVVLLGTDPNSLDFPIDWDTLAADMLHNLNTYWRSYTKNPTRMAWLLSDYGIQWTVLGTLRQMYSFKEQSLTSKIGAGEYGLNHLPEKWHRIIQEALHIRSQTNKSLYKSRLSRALDAVKFLNFIINFCNTHFARTTKTVKSESL